MPQTKHDIDQLNRVGFCDPASGKVRLKKTRARQAIVCIAADDLMRVFVTYSWAGRLSTNKFIDKILTVCENYQLKPMGIEANAMQSLFADVVRNEAKRRLTRLSIVPVTQTTKVDKDFRIRASIEPVINNGRLFINETKHPELYAELQGFPTAATKDLVDCLASSIALLPKRAPKQARHAEADQLARYLRNTGKPSWYIERRVKEVYGDI